MRKKQITGLSSLVKNQGEIFESKRSIVHSKILPYISKAKQILLKGAKQTSDSRLKDGAIKILRLTLIRF